MKDLKSLSEFILFKVFIFFIKLLPSRVSFKIIIKLFIFIVNIIKSRKKLIFRQLKSAFPDKSIKELQEIVYKNYINMAITTFEMFILKHKYMFKSIETEGWNNLEEALGRGKGVILVSAHFGNWELAGQYISSHNIKISVIVKKIRNKYIDQYISKIRQSDNINLIYKKNSLKSILKALINNHVLCILSDQNAGKEGFYMDFLGTKASVFTGPAKIALKTKSPILFAVSKREIDYKNLDLKKIGYTLYFDKPLYPDELPCDSNQEILITNLLNRKLENWVKSHPEQWFWIHRRWRGAEKARKNI